MRSVLLAAATTGLLVFPTAAMADPGLPPTDPIKMTPCQPDYPCDPTPYYDTTYPKRVLTWAVDLLP